MKLLDAATLRTDSVALRALAVDALELTCVWQLMFHQQAGLHQEFYIVVKSGTAHLKLDFIRHLLQEHFYGKAPLNAVACFQNLVAFGRFSHPVAFEIFCQFVADYVLNVVRVHETWYTPLNFAKIILFMQRASET